MESSFDCYTPLERPGATTSITNTTAHAPDREEGECDTDSDSPAAAESSEDSDTNVPTQRAILLPRRKRAPITAPPQQSSTTRKKYDIWTEKIREDSLTETMRNFGVNREGGDGRSIEWYDHTLGNRFAKDGKTNRLKRRRSSGAGPRSRAPMNGREEDEDEEEEDDDNAMECSGGKRVCYNNRKQNRARLLEDIEAGEDARLEDFAKELAEKLKESNEALILQVTTVLGRGFVQNIYKETQRIEEDGGMMIRNNMRRRTSGGVFFFLIKHDDDITEEKKREAFKAIPDPSEEAAKRDEEIEELKKSLITQDSPKMRPKLDSIRSQDTCSTLSNPPPSPSEEDPNNNQNSITNDPSSCMPFPNSNEHMDFN